MVKYQIEFGKIKTLEVLRETKASVFVKEGMSPSGERKISKRSEWSSIHDTWADAKQHLLVDAESKLRAARRSLELAQARIGNIKGMKPPAA